MPLLRDFQVAAGLVDSEPPLFQRLAEFVPADDFDSPVASPGDLNPVRTPDPAGSDPVLLCFSMALSTLTGSITIESLRTPARETAVAATSRGLYNIWFLGRQFETES